MCHTLRKNYVPFLTVLMLIMGCTGNKENSIMEEKATPVSYITSFQFNKPDRIEIELFSKLSDQSSGVPATKKLEITDENAIAEIVNAAAPLPDKGDIMIKMGDVSVINVTLVYPENKLYFAVYGDRIKTPDTSFYSVSPDNEKMLVKILIGLLDVVIE
jgi:hypothetical protein